MRFKSFLDDDFNVLGFVYLTGQVNEASDEFVEKVQNLGHKMGIRVTRTKTFQDHMKKAGNGVLDLMKIVAKYSVEADILDSAARKKLEQDIKAKFAKVKKEDVIAFMVNLDKTFLGITSIPRHILQNIVGVELTSYNNWVSDQQYVESSMRKIIEVLTNMKDEENLMLAKRIYKNVTGKDI